MIHSKQPLFDKEIWLGLNYLLCKGVGWSSISVALAVDGGLCTSTNGIHFPVSVVVVHHMEIPVPTPALSIVHVLILSEPKTNSGTTNWYRISAVDKPIWFHYWTEDLPWHSLDKSLPKVVVSNCHLHCLVSGIRVTMAQQHHLVFNNIDINVKI